MNLPPRLTKGRKRSKIPDPILMEVLTKIGCFEKDYRIMQWLKETHNITVNVQTITHYRFSDKYETYIKQARDKFESHMFALELSSKRRRLEELSEIYWIVKEKKQYDKACKVLEQIRYEKEGSKVETGDIFQFNQYNAFSDEQLKDKLQINMKLIEDIKAKKLLTTGEINGERN